MLSKDSKKGTNIIDRVGHTSGPYGHNVEANPKGVAGSKPRDLKLK